MTHSLADVDKASFDSLIEKLEEPEVAASLGVLLDHTDLIAVLLVGLHGLVSRSETIGDAVASGIADMRSLDGSAAGDVGSLAADLSDLLRAMPKVASGLAEFADAGILDQMIIAGLTQPESVDKIGALAKGVAIGLTEEPPEVNGVLSLLRHLKDSDVSRGIGFTLGVLKGIGSQLGDKPAG